MGVESFSAEYPEGLRKRIFIHLSSCNIMVMDPKFSASLSTHTFRSGKWIVQEEWDWFGKYLEFADAL